ncbi:hypothetical protein B0T13DRAFT_523633 [Neurospora crassa]|nr:hypothetical protein B0T13DRAFT_523633 [Neurospora crassa]
MKPRLQGITVVVASGGDEVGSYPEDDGHKDDMKGSGRVIHQTIASYFSQVGLQLNFNGYAIPKLTATDSIVNNDSNLDLGSGVYIKAGRGYPDVSAVDDHYLVRFAGDWHEIGSTSLAAPVWGTVLTLAVKIEKTR